MNSATSDLALLLAECHDDPLLFVERVLRATPRRWQRRAFEAIGARLQAGETRLEVLIRACHSAGKSWLLAAVTLWYTSTRPQARGLTTAEIWRTVEEVVWPEIRRLYAGSLLADLNVGRVLNTSIEFGPAWLCAGAASDRPETLEGVHSPTAGLRIIDEGKSVPSGVFVSTQGILAAPESLDLWSSTPNTRAGEFYMRDLFGGDRLLRFVVTADDLVREGVPGIAEWKADCARKWGVESAAYQSRVMAEYVDDAWSNLYPVAWVDAAMTKPWDVAGPVVCGIDPAWSAGADETGCAVIAGPDDQGRYRVSVAAGWHEVELERSKARAVEAARSAGAGMIFCDVAGWGANLASAIRAEFPVTDFRASDPPSDKTRFLNRKAETSWMLRDLLEKGAVRLPQDATLRTQMLAAGFEISARGLIRVVDGSDSPDRLDAILCGLEDTSRQYFKPELLNRMVVPEEAEPVAPAAVRPPVEPPRVPMEVTLVR